MKKLIPLDVVWVVKPTDANINVSLQEERNLVITLTISVNDSNEAVNKTVQLVFKRYSTVCTQKDVSFSVLRGFGWNHLPQCTEITDIVELVECCSQVLFSYIEDCDTLSRLDRRDSLRRYLLCNSDYYVDFIAGDFTYSILD